MRGLSPVLCVAKGCLVAGCAYDLSGQGGTRIAAAPELAAEKRWPVPTLRLPVRDQGVVMNHGNGAGHCDYLGARYVWVWEHRGTYYMHYDGAGPKGRLVYLATGVVIHI